jgi:acetoacetate decarboxylase
MVRSGCHRHHGYKHKSADLDAVRASLATPNFCSRSFRTSTAPREFASLVEYQLEDVTLKGAWTGPAALSLVPHALAPVADLPVLEIVSSVHLICDLTLGLGKVAYDYLPPARREPALAPATAGAA